MINIKVRVVVFFYRREGNVFEEEYVGVCLGISNILVRFLIWEVGIN